MLRKFSTLSLVIAALFFSVVQIKAQSGMSDTASLYWNLSLRQLGVPNSLNEPYYFGSPNAPTQTWHPGGGDMQAPVGYLGLFSLTNTDAVMRNLDTIIQNTRMTSNDSTFDPVFGMRYSNALVNNAITSSTTSNVSSTTNTVTTVPSEPPPTFGSATVQPPTINVVNVANSVVNSGTSMLSTGTMNINGAGTTGLTKMGAGTLTMASSTTYAGPTTINAGTLAINAGVALPANVTLGGGVLQTAGDASTFNGTLTLTGPSTCSGITTVNTGALQLNLNNPWAGNITLGEGALQLTTNGNTSIQAGTLNLNSASVLNTQLSYPGTINLTQAGTGTLRLTGASTLGNAGGYTIINGFDSTTNTAGVLAFNGGLLRATSMSVDTLTIGGISAAPVVPEPSISVLLAAAGIAGLFGIRLRRQS